MNKEEINGASSNQSIGENDAREQRSPRLSVILGDCYEEFPGIDNIEKSQNPTPGNNLTIFSSPSKSSIESQMTHPIYGKEWRVGKLKDKITEDLGNSITDGFQN
ncbi:hypothetical protein V6N11_007981 [Hibiscus sabdariffa]|uniref:Uncharacterized protein n=1 Tax=Hibiscus sabdariffa TaxID=183260 RepID=A0ABR2PZ94_9ROSI